MNSTGLVGLQIGVDIMILKDLLKKLDVDDIGMETPVTIILSTSYPEQDDTSSIHFDISEIWVDVSGTTAERQPENTIAFICGQPKYVS